MPARLIARAGQPGGGKSMRGQLGEAHRRKGKEERQDAHLHEREPDLHIAAELDPFGDDGANRHKPKRGHQGDGGLTVDETRRQQLQRRGGGGKGPGNHEDDGTDDQRPPGEKTEYRREDRRDPRIGGTSVDRHAVQMAEGEHDAEHDEAAIEETGRRQHAHGAD